MNIRVLVCDEQAVTRAGLRAMLEPEPDIAIVGEAENRHQALSTVRRLRPDVVLIGTGLPLLDGTTTTRLLAGRGVERPIPVVIVGTPERKDGVLEALEAGASGFVYKDTPAPELAHAVRVVAKGGALLSPLATRRLRERLRQPPAPNMEVPAALAKLTKRELEVLRLLTESASIRQIAEGMGVARTTVRSHIHHMLAKLGFEDRVQAVALAYKHGLVSPD